MKDHFLSDLLKKKTWSKTKLTIYLPPDLIKSIKHFCVDNDITISECIEKAITEFLKKHTSFQDQNR